MSGKLFVVGTPIGNLGDFSPRAIEVLSSVDCIAAEDTRVTRKLLSHFDIHTPMLSYYEHNKEERENEIINKIKDGRTFAIVTDAGMPCISDPGEELVKACYDNGIDVESVPGPSAAITALAISGLSTSRFSFEGFLSVTKNARQKHLDEIKDYPYTMIFYEAPHKLKATLKDLEKVLGNRRISLCRELTKVHEEVIRTTLEDSIHLYDDQDPRGEYVIIVEGVGEKKEISMSFDDAVLYAKKLMDEGTPISMAAKTAARESGFAKGEIYKELL